MASLCAYNNTRANSQSSNYSPLFTKRINLLAFDYQYIAIIY